MELIKKVVVMSKVKQMVMVMQDDFLRKIKVLVTIINFQFSFKKYFVHSYLNYFPLCLV